MPRPSLPKLAGAGVTALTATILLVGCISMDTSQVGAPAAPTRSPDAPSSDPAQQTAPPEFDEEDERANGRVADASTHPRCDRVAYAQFWKDDGAADDAPSNVEMWGSPVDTGNTTGADGSSESVEGSPVSYSVVQGDNMRAISARFCWDMVNLMTLNGIRDDALTQGQTISLIPLGATIDLDG